MPSPANHSRTELPEDFLNLEQGRKRTRRLLKRYQKSLKTPIVVGENLLSRRLVYSALLVVSLLLTGVGIFIGRWSTISSSEKETVTTAEVSKKNEPTESPEAKKVRELRERLQQK